MLLIRRRLLFYAMLSLALTLLVLAVAARYTPQNMLAVDRPDTAFAGTFPDVPRHYADAPLPAHAVLVDVRTDAERAVSMLPGAFSEADYTRRRAEFGGRPVIVYCTIGYRSGVHARTLRQQGVDARNLHGGILAWAGTGKPLLDSQRRPTRRVHVYDERWAAVPVGYIAVW